MKVIHALNHCYAWCSEWLHVYCYEVTILGVAVATVFSLDARYCNI